MNLQELSPVSNKKRQNAHRGLDVAAEQLAEVIGIT